MEEDAGVVVVSESELLVWILSTTTRPLYTHHPRPRRDRRCWPLRRYGMPSYLPTHDVILGGLICAVFVHSKRHGSRADNVSNSWSVLVPGEKTRDDPF